MLDLGNQLGLKDNDYATGGHGVVSALYAGNKIAIGSSPLQPALANLTSDREAIARVLKTKLKSGASGRLSMQSWRG